MTGRKSKARENDEEFHRRFADQIIEQRFWVRANSKSVTLPEIKPITTWATMRLFFRSGDSFRRRTITTRRRCTSWATARDTPIG